MKLFFVCLILLLNDLFVHAQIKKNNVESFGCNVESVASFPGEELAWKNYLKQNFKEEAVKCQMQSHDAVYTQVAEIWFVIERDGSVTDVKCINTNSINIALKDEAIRLIANSPKWKPGQQNGRTVKAFRKEKISIIVSPQYL